MKVKNSRSLIITSRKWYTTLDSEFIYTYLEKTLKNRPIKDEITQQLNRRDIPTNVFCRELSFKGKLEKISSYIIATPYDKFLNIFSNIDLNSSNLKIDKIFAETE